MSEITPKKDSQKPQDVSLIELKETSHEEHLKRLMGLSQRDLMSITALNLERVEAINQAIHIWNRRPKIDHIAEQQKAK